MRIRPFHDRAVRAVRLGKKNLNCDTNDFRGLEVVELCLLCAVDADLLAGIKRRKDIGSEKTDRFDVGAGLWGLQVEDVFVQELAKGVVVSLTEEICFAHGGGGERRVEGESWRGKKQSRGEE